MTKEEIAAYKQVILCNLVVSTTKQEQSLENQEANNDLVQSINNITKIGHVGLAIQVETYFNAFYAREDMTKEAANSIKAAITQGVGAIHTYNNLKQNPKAYQITAKDHQLDNVGLPKDACRSFIQSHITRLGNRLADYNPEDKEAIYARKEMMHMVRREYIKEQKQTLGIPFDKKASEIDAEKGDALRKMPIKELKKKYPDLKPEIFAIETFENKVASFTSKHLREELISGMRSNLADRYDNNERIKPAHDKAQKLDGPERS